jgi:hypothetical protein
MTRAVEYIRCPSVGDLAAYTRQFAAVTAQLDKLKDRLGG